MSRSDNLLDINNPARVIQIAGKRFSVGLLWQPLLGLQSIKQEVVEFAQAESMNLAVVYQQTDAQAGFVATSETKLFAGTYSLASVLAEKLGDSWLGVFEVDNDNWVLLAVHDGMIVPGCDLIGTRSEIQDQLQEISLLNPWGMVYLSDEESMLNWIPDTANYEVQTLDQLLTAKKYKKSHRLYEIREGVSKTALIALGAVVGIGLIAFGGKWYMDNVQSKNRQKVSMMAQITKSRQMEADRAMWRERVQAATPKPDWYEKPSSGDFIAGCNQWLETLPVNVAGWALIEIQCKPDAFQSTYRFMQGTTMADFQTAAAQMKHNQMVTDFAVDVEQASLTWPTADWSPRGKQDVTSFTQWSIGWLSLFQLLGIGSELTHLPVSIPGPISVEAVELLGVAEATPPPPWWTTHSWKFSTLGINPTEVLNQVPDEGFVIDLISAQIGSSPNWTWQAQGKIYTQ